MTDGLCHACEQSARWRVAKEGYDRGVAVMLVQFVCDEHLSTWLIQIAANVVVDPVVPA